MCANAKERAHKLQGRKYIVNTNGSIIELIQMRALAVLPCDWETWSERRLSTVFWFAFDPVFCLSVFEKTERPDIELSSQWWPLQRSVYMETEMERSTRYRRKNALRIATAEKCFQFRVTVDNSARNTRGSWNREMLRFNGTGKPVTSLTTIITEGLNWTS